MLKSKIKFLLCSALHEDKSLVRSAPDLIFTTDLQTSIITQQFTAGADLFLKHLLISPDAYQLSRI